MKSLQESLNEAKLEPKVIAYNMINNCLYTNVNDFDNAIRMMLWGVYCSTDDYKFTMAISDALSEMASSLEKFSEAERKMLKVSFNNVGMEFKGAHLQKNRNGMETIFAF